MSHAFKENSRVPSRARSEKSDYEGRKATVPEGPRQALSAKPINTDSNHQSRSFQKPNFTAKRLPSRESSAVAAGESKRPKLLESIASDDTDSDQTDEDSNEQSSGAASGPYSQAFAQRSISRRKVLYPRPKLTDIGELEIDYPSTNQEHALPDSSDDILEGIDLSPVRMQPPRFIPEFLRELNEKLKVSLDDFSDLDIGDGSELEASDDSSNSSSELRDAHEMPE